MPETPPTRQGAPAFRRTLIQVMLVQAAALVLLWLLQARYSG